jgi:hypothetical protein
MRERIGKLPGARDRGAGQQFSVMSELHFASWSGLLKKKNRSSCFFLSFWHNKNISY